MKRVVVTGGAGFLGGHVVDALLRRHSDAHVVIFDRAEYAPEGDVDKNRISSVRGDVTQLGEVAAALVGADAVIHCASADPVDNTNQKLMMAVNVEGTRNIIEACKQCRVNVLVHVSSASVVYNGELLDGVDETYPFPEEYRDHYSHTKAQAERLVLSASRGPLATCALRPSAIFGPRDRAYLPRLIEAARAGKSKYIIGTGRNMWDMTYVENIAGACVDVAERLVPGSNVAGQAYFVTNCEPVPFWKYSGNLLEGLGYERPRIPLPFWLCFAIACIIEGILFLLRPWYKPRQPPSLSRARVRLLTTSRTFSCAKAKRDFGYEPRFDMEEAATRTIEYFKRLSTRASIAEGAGKSDTKKK